MFRSVELLLLETHTMSAPKVGGLPCRRRPDSRPESKDAAQEGAAPERERATKSGEHFVFLEPAHHLVPGVLGSILAIAFPIVGVESVWRARIELELGDLAGGLEPRLHVLDLLDWDAGVSLAVKAEHGKFHCGSDAERVFRHCWSFGVGKAAVEGDAGLEVAVVARILPHGPSAAAEAHDPGSGRVAALRLRPGKRRIEIGEQLAV